AVREILERERRDGVATIAYYEGFADRVAELRRTLIDLMTSLKREGKRLAAYGAAAKGSTLCNYMRIDTELIAYVVDRSPQKQGKYLPGVRVPIRPVEALVEDRPDVVLLLAWNFADEILEQQREYRERGGQFLVPMPSPRLI
ncbi:MAG: methyltransferase C-terminal domain-containing protein, partial [bacterium]